MPGRLSSPDEAAENIKGKVVPIHTMKAYRGSRGTTPLILNLGTG
jgi:hypothetical protein